MLSSKPAKKDTKDTTVEFVVRVLDAEPDSSSLYCTDCQIPYNLIQPDENDPCRLLGTCEGCSKWVYLVEVEPEWKTSLIIELPNTETLQERVGQVKTRPTGTAGVEP